MSRSRDNVHEGTRPPHSRNIACCFTSECGIAIRSRVTSHVDAIQTLDQIRDPMEENPINGPIYSCE